MRRRKGQKAILLLPLLMRATYTGESRPVCVCVCVCVCACVRARVRLRVCSGEISYIPGKHSWKCVCVCVCVCV
jgi:hypothetical protein